MAAAVETPTTPTPSTSPVEAQPAPRRDSWLRRNGPLVLLLAGFMVLTTAFNVLNPIWEGIDEPAHFQDVKYIAETGRLPTYRLELPTLFPYQNCANVHCVATGSATSQPQLYYALGALLVSRIDLNTYVSWVPNPYFTWAHYPLRYGAAVHTLTEHWPYRGMVLGVHVLRFMSGLLGMGTVIAAYLTALIVTGNRRFGLAVGGLVALTPGFLMSTALVTDDNAAAFTASAALLFGVKALRAARWRWLWALLFLGSAILAYASKTDTLFLAPAAVLLVLLAIRWSTVALDLSKLVSRRKVALVASAVAVAVFIIAFARYLEKVAAQGWLAALKRTVVAAQTAPCPNCRPLEWLWGSIPDLFDTLWGSFGWETFHLPSAFYQVLFVVCTGAGLGLLYGLFHWFQAPIWPSLRPWVFLATSALILFVVVVYRVVATRSDGGTTHARFLFPVIVPIMCVLALGLWSLPASCSRVGFPILFATLFAATGYSLWTVPHAFSWAPVYGDVASAGVEQPLSASFDRGMGLVGVNLAHKRLAQGGQVHLRLFWVARRPVDFDYSAFVRLKDDSGHVIHDQDHVPGVRIGLLTHEWQTGEVVPDDWTLNIPRTAVPGAYNIEVGVYDYRNMQPLLDQSAAAATMIGTVTITAASG